MKKLLLLIFLFCNALVFAQKNTTTTEEYNYLLKGIKTQKESGLDIEKKGYLIKNIGPNKSVQIDNYYFNAKVLILSSTNEKKGIVFIMKSALTNVERYLVMPYNNNELYGIFTTSINNLSSLEKTSFAKAVSYYLAINI